MIGHDGNMEFVFQDLHSEHGQSTLWSHLNEDASASVVHRFDLFGPFNRRRHLWSQFLKNRRLGIIAILRVKGAVNVGGDGNGWPPNLKFLQETTQRFVRWCDNAGMEGVGSCQFNAIEPLGFKRRHGFTNRCCLPGDHRHLWRILVGCDDVALGGFQHRFHLAVGSGNTGHEAFVVNLDRPHFGASSSGGPERTVHVQNSRRHQRSVFTKGVPRHHIGHVTKGLQGSLYRQVSGQHRRLCVLRLLEFVLGFLSFFIRERGAQDETGECFAVKDLHHRLVRLLPYGCRRRKSLCKVGGHAHVLASLTGIHVDALCF